MEGYQFGFGKWLRALALVVSLGVFACVPEPRFADPTFPGGGRSGILLLNEGQWTQNNSSLDFYDETDNFRRYPDVFRAANGFALGDVGHSLLRILDTLYIVVNNSQRVYKLQLPGLRVLGRLDLPPGASPRRVVALSADEYWVNSLLDARIYRFDPRTMQLLGEIPLVPHPEEMLRVGNRVFVTCGSYPGAVGRKLATLDTQTGTVLGYLDLPIENPGPLVALADGRVAVGLRGNYLNTGCGVTLLNPLTGVVDTTLRLTGSLYDMMALPGNRLLLNTDSAYTLLRLDNLQVQYNWLSRATLGARSSDLLYSTAYDSLRNELYVFNAGFGAQNATGLVLDPETQQVKRRFEAGLFPGELLFYRP